MTVVFNRKDQQKFVVDQVLWQDKDLINQMVEMALVSQTEAFIDMIMDGQADMSRNAINETLRGVKDSAGEFLADMIGDLQRAVEKRLEAVNYGAAVTGIKYDLAGDVTDIEVNVSVGVE